MEDLYNELYSKIPENVAQPINVANPTPLYNSTVIKENGKYDVSSFAVAKIDVEGGEGGGEGYMGLKGISIPVTYVFPEDASYTAADITNVSMKSTIFMGESQIEFNNTPVGDFSNWDLPFIEDDTTSLFVDTVYVDDTGFMLNTSNCTCTGDIAYDESNRLINISGNGTMQLVLDWID